MSTPPRLPTTPAGPIAPSELRAAVSQLSTRAKQAVSSVRTAFTTGAPPSKVAGSGSVADFITRFAGDGVAAQVVRSTTRLGLHTSDASAAKTPPRPELDHVEVDHDSSIGVLDAFYTKVVVSVAEADVAAVSSLRIMRAAHGRIDAPIPSISALIDGIPIGGTTKSYESISNTAFRVADVGVGNQLTDLVKDDPFSRQRAVVSSGNLLRTAPALVNTNRRYAGSSLLSIDNVDPSVLSDPTFYVNRRTVSPVQEVTQPLVVAQRQGINVLAGSGIAKSVDIVEASNAMGYSEIARLPIVGPSVGGFVEIDCIDRAVVYGTRYTYYAVLVTKDGIEGPRSRIVTVDVVRRVSPPAPTVFYNVVAGSPRFSIQCSASFADHVEVFRRGGTVPEIIRAISTPSALAEDLAPTTTDSGYYHLTDVPMGVSRGTVFVDRDVTPGQSIDYRIYLVDSFGMKSQTPFSCSIRLPDHGKNVPLPVASITAEQTPGGRQVSVKLFSDDPRCTGFVVGRRDASLSENAYREPSQPDYFTLGVPNNGKVSRSRSGPLLNQFSAGAWGGFYPTASGSVELTDLTVQFDRTYQYSVQAVDIRGNVGPSAISPLVFVAVKPVSDVPVALSATVVPGDGESPDSVLLEWDTGTSDFSPNDLVGDQDVLNATSIRSVFQIERKSVGSSIWEAMPATTESYFVDPVSTDVAPKFRPEYVRTDLSYDYRVIAMQSGGFISQHSDPIRVSATPTIAAPPTVWVRSTSSSVRPISVVVSWQYDGTFVDSWEVERAVTNKIYGSKILSMDSSEARGLQYSPIARVTREASRSRGVNSTDLRLDVRTYVGNRFYVDHSIDLANSYYYRVRAVDSNGRTTAWSYGGISLTDSPHDRKFFSALSDHEKASMTQDPRPVLKWRP